MIRGTFLFLLGGALFINGLRIFFGGLIESVNDYTEHGHDIASALGVFFFGLLFTCLYFAFSYACYIYGKEAFEDAEEEKRGAPRPSFKDIAKSQTTK